MVKLHDIEVWCHTKSIGASPEEAGLARRTIMARRDLIRVLVVDETAAAREGVRGLVWPEDDITVAGEAANAAEALEQVRVHQFDVAVLDLSLQGGKAWSSWPD
jgi:hypothetical protein